LREIASSAPASFTVHARDPAKSLTFGSGQEPAFGPVYGPPKVRNLEGGFESANSQHYRWLLEQVQQQPSMATSGHMLCVLNEVPVACRALEMSYLHLSLSDKVMFGPTTGVRDMHIAYRLADAAYDYGSKDDCRMLHLVNSVPPLTYTPQPLIALRTAARAGQASVISSLMMSGATGATTLMGQLAQAYAEVLLGVALSQLYRPGAPVLFGHYSTGFDMSKMTPNFGQPLSFLSQCASGQLADRLQLPNMGYGGFCSSKVEDWQAKFESANTTQAALHAGSDLILHAAGWLDNGRTTGMQKLLDDCQGLPAFRDFEQLPYKPLGARAELLEAEYATIKQELQSLASEY